MDAVTPTLIVVGCVNLLMFPVLTFVLKRYLGRMLDGFDQKREDARLEQERESERTEAHQTAIEKGMRSLLRAELIHEHRKWHNKGYCPLESKEYVQHTYEAYHGLGGNDIGTSMYHDIMKLPTKEMGE